MLQEVMSWLEDLAQDDWRERYSDSDVQATALVVLAMLREQEPVKPIKTLDGNGNLWRDCGKCGGVLPKNAQYCPTCGRKVKRE